mgnify:CR=1 FL=1
MAVIVTFSNRSYFHTVITLKQKKLAATLAAIWSTSNPKLSSISSMRVCKRMKCVLSSKHYEILLLSWVRWMLPITLVSMLLRVRPSGMMNLRWPTRTGEDLGGVIVLTPLHLSLECLCLRLMVNGVSGNQVNDCKDIYARKVKAIYFIQFSDE